MTQIADIADRLRRLAKRREDEGIYTDAELCNEAARALQAVGPEPVAWRDDVKCECVGAFGPNPECRKCGGSGCFSALVATPPAERVVVALPPTSEYVDRIVRIFRDRPADDTSAVVLQDYARAALSGSGSGWPVPDGWKLVPVELTSEMCTAGYDAVDHEIGMVDIAIAYRAMIAASPAAPQQGGE